MVLSKASGWIQLLGRDTPVMRLREGVLNRGIPAPRTWLLRLSHINASQCFAFWVSGGWMVGQFEAPAKRPPMKVGYLGGFPQEIGEQRTKPVENLGVVKCFFIRDYNYLRNLLA